MGVIIKEAAKQGYAHTVHVRLTSFKEKKTLQRGKDNDDGNERTQSHDWKLTGVILLCRLQK